LKRALFIAGVPQVNPFTKAQREAKPEKQADLI
jgi:hypothetical protein